MYTSDIVAAAEKMDLLGFRARCLHLSHKKVWNLVL